MNIPSELEVGDDLFFVFASPVMRRLRSQAELLSRVNVPVLILGESGTGKKTAARLIHKLSDRSAAEFARINCAALPGDVLEAELFGSENPAQGQGIRKGIIEGCDRGTIFLDEITEMPSNLQSKLLHLLQDKVFLRAGGSKTINVDVRILAGSSVNLGEALSAKKLREDLFYRLSAFTVQLPPLRDRREEIPALLAHLMKKLAKQLELSPRPLSPLLVSACQQHSWPGNLHELENVVKRYLVMGDEFLDEVGGTGLKLVGHSDDDSYVGLSEEDINLGNGNADHHDPASLKILVRTIKGETEKNVIANMLEKTHWNRKAAARELGISYRGLLYKIQEYQLIPPTTFVPRTPTNGTWKR